MTTTDTPGRLTRTPVLAAAGLTRRGRVLAGLVTGIFLGQFLSPIVVGPLVAAAGLSGAFTWAGLLTTAGAASAAPLLLRPHHGRHPHA